MILPKNNILFLLLVPFLNVVALAQIHTNSSVVLSGVNPTENGKLVGELLASASSNKKKTRRQNGKSGSRKKPKVTSYSTPDGYLEIIESEPQSYSTSFHTETKDPRKNFSTDDRSSKEKGSRRERRRDNFSDYPRHNDGISNDSGNRGGYQDVENYPSYLGSSGGYGQNTRSGDEHFNNDDDYDYRLSRRNRLRNNERYNRDQNAHFPQDSSEEGRERDPLPYNNARDFFQGFDDVDGYGQPRRSDERNRNPHRGQDEGEYGNEYDYNDGNYDDYGHQGFRRRSDNENSRRGRNGQRRDRDRDFHFDFDENDPFGEQEFRQTDRGRNRNTYSGNVVPSVYQ